MSATASQIEDLTSLRSEIEGIERDARLGAAAPTEEGTAGGAGLSYSFYSSGVSFGIFSSPESTVAAIEKSIRETLATLAPVATFETSQGGFAARTAINYSGRADSVWSGSLSPELVEGHMSTLKRAYAFRAAVVGVIAATGSALASISVAVANPLTALQALRSAQALKLAVERLAAAVKADALGE